MAKEQDQSMEEILQSIKRIIAEESEPAPSGSDVLELTELLSDEDSQKLVDNSQSNEVPSMSIEEIMAAPVEAPTNAPIEAPAPKPAPTMAAIDSNAKDDGTIISDETIDKSAAAMAALHRMPYSLPPIPPSGLQFRSGTTIEDLVLEALRPMLKSWLDEYLPGMVERLVEKEVRRVSGRP